MIWERQKNPWMVDRQKPLNSAFGGRVQGDLCTRPYCFWWLSDGIGKLDELVQYQTLVELR